jgi:hypothetical protein
VAGILSKFGHSQNEWLDFTFESSPILVDNIVPIDRAEKIKTGTSWLNKLFEVADSQSYRGKCLRHRKKTKEQKNSHKSQARKRQATRATTAEKTHSIILWHDQMTHH